jgi:malate permease and related proteins
LIQYINLFLNNLLPIFLAAAAGYLLARWLPINPRTLSSIAFYIFTPCLVFSSLTHTELSNDDIFKIILFTVVSASLVGLLTWLIGRGLRLERTVLSAVMLTSMFMNAGNYGLPVTLFAFGNTALAYATLFFAINSILTNTAGVVIISMGSANFKKAFTNLFKTPVFYALILAILFISMNWRIPLFFERTTKILGDASIPILMILLGVQFHYIKLKGKIVPLTLASVMRLLVSPALAIGLSAVFGLYGPARQAVVLEAAMPAAVVNTVLATQFETESPFVSAVVVATTILSIFTLTPLLAYLGG